LLNEREARGALKIPELMVLKMRGETHASCGEVDDEQNLRCSAETPSHRRRVQKAIL
jgi:hypothetical protein